MLLPWLGCQRARHELYVVWSLVSRCGIAFALWKRKLVFIVSPAIYVVYIVANYLATPDNLFTRTMDAATVCGIVFGVLYAALNGWLLYRFRQG